MATQQPQGGTGQRGWERIIGTDPSCCFPDFIPDPNVYSQSYISKFEPKHAIVRWREYRIYIKDLGSKMGTFLNDKKIKSKQWVEIIRYDKISIGGDSRSSVTYTFGPQLFIGEDQYEVNTTKLKLVATDRDKKILCDSSFIRAKPGRFTVIMGLSGSGKSVLLELLNAYRKPDSGQILFGNKYDIRTDYGIIKEFLGYVPQDDIMIPQLTVRQSLHYRLKLRYKDMDEEVRERLIKGTCKHLGVDSRPDEMEKYLQSVIGSSALGIRGTSGGERKRANIAHELITGPLILCLDEPTSGLSSVEADQLIENLKKLAEVDGLTIIATVHQPSKEAFDMFDDLLLLSKGGKIAYYGPASEATKYLERVTGVPCTKNPAGYLTEMLKDHNVKLVQAYESELYSNPILYKPYQPSASPGAPPPVKPPASPAPGAPGHSQQPKKTIAKGKKVSGFAQWWVLLSRNLRVLSKDKRNWQMIVGQVPVIVLLIVMGFFHFNDDEKKITEFYRTIHYFHQAADELGKAGKTVMFETELDRAKKKALTPSTDTISYSIGTRRGSIYFLAVACAIWFGIMGSCKEVVTEQHILKREARSCINIFPYLFAKMSMMILVVGIQTGVLVLLLAPLLLKLSAVSSVLLWLDLWVAGTVAAALGLLLSSSFKSITVVLALVPLFIIPQLLLGGLLRPLVISEEVTAIPKLLSAITIQRWAFEPALLLDTYAKQGILVQKPTDISKRGGKEIDLLQVENRPLVEIFFRKNTIGHVILPVAFLTGLFIFFFVTSFIVLKKRFL